MSIEKEIYIVVVFGCNSGSHDMWVPTTHIFTDKDKAFLFYHDNAPSLNDKDNRAKKQLLYSTCDYIDAIMQVPGYIDGDSSCAKRPYGIKISRHIIQLN